MLETIMEPVGNWTRDTISSMGYPGIALLMAIESACIPLPSEIIMPFSGFLVAQGRFTLFGTALAGAVGCAVGSAVAYAAGTWGGRPFLERWGRYVLIRRSDIDRADRWFARWGMWAVFVSRLMPVVRTFISLPAGIARVSFVPFILLSFLGSLPWCWFLAWIGKVMGENWDTLGRWFHGADVIILGVGLVLFVIWLRHHLRPEPEEAA